MEDVTLSGFDWLFRLGTGGGFVALLWVTVRFFGSSQKDATDSALALYKLVKEERDQFAAEIGGLRVEIAALRLELEEERRARQGLERQLAQTNSSAAYLIRTRTEPKI